jgi:hypothetical protein
MTHMGSEKFVELATKISEEMAHEALVPVGLMQELLMAEAEPVFSHFIQRVQYEICKSNPLNIH